MIAVLVAQALAGVGCATAPTAHVGAGALGWYDAEPALAAFPWEVGFDVMGVVSPVECLRTGVRYQPYWDRFDAGLDPSGVEAHHKLWLTVGTDLALHDRVEVGVHALLGGRLLYSKQAVAYPDLGIDRTYRATSLRPSAYGYVVARVWILPFLGVHVDGQVAVADHRREYSWYTNRVLGAGIGGRLP